MLHLCVRHVAAAGGIRPSRSVGHLYGNGPFHSLRSLPFCIYTEATPCHSHRNGTPAICHFNVTRGKRRENGCIPGSIAASGRWIKDCNRLDTHYDAPTYELQLLGIREVCSFVRGLAAADKAEWGRRRPD